MMESHPVDTLAAPHGNSLENVVLLTIRSLLVQPCSEMSIKLPVDNAAAAPLYYMQRIKQVYCKDTSVFNAV